MALYEIGISFTTSSEHTAHVLHRQILDVLKKYDYLFNGTLPTLDVYDSDDDDDDSDDDDYDSDYDDDDNY